MYNSTSTGTLCKLLTSFSGRTGLETEGAINGRTGDMAVRSTPCEILYDTSEIASWNIGTMRGRTSEIIKTITIRNIDLAVCKRSGGEVLQQDL